jgi:hypothetical protein
MNSDEWRRRLNDPIDPPAPPPELSVDTTHLERIEDVDITAHRVAWRTASGRMWQAKYDAWLLHVLPYLTVDQHAAWMDQVFQCDNVPVLKWHVAVLRRIVTGHDHRQPTNDRPAWKSHLPGESTPSRLPAPVEMSAEEAAEWAAYAERDGYDF